MFTPLEAKVPHFEESHSWVLFYGKREDLFTFLPHAEVTQSGPVSVLSFLVLKAPQWVPLHELPFSLGESTTVPLSESQAALPLCCFL